MATATEHHVLDDPSFVFPPKILIVSSPYYKAIAEGLVGGARAVLARCGAKTDLVEVPGALEIPAAIALSVKAGGYDGYVALGCVIRGETTHYETVCNDSSRGLMQLGLQGVAIGNGILTVETMAQAEQRADPARGDKGGGAALAALHLCRLRERWSMQ